MQSKLVCDSYENSFSRDRDLPQHHDDVHKSRRHECEDCKKSFSRLWNLKRHQKSCHNKSSHEHEKTSNRRIYINQNLCQSIWLHAKILEEMHADEKRLRKEMEYAYMEEKNKRKELENIIINLEDELYVARQILQHSNEVIVRENLARRKEAIEKIRQNYYKNLVASSDDEDIIDSLIAPTQEPIIKPKQEPVEPVYDSNEILTCYKCGVKFAIHQGEEFLKHMNQCNYRGS